MSLDYKASVVSSIAIVKQRMAEACKRSGRHIDSVTLLAVTKFSSPRGGLCGIRGRY
ncbi:hypothetical protein MASR2M48_07290 [Spirochaetota bacterium]